MPSGYSLYSFCRYTTFGSPMPSRSFSASSYRYGFNGKEKDDEVSGNGNEVDFGARNYDSRLGRWWAIDPLTFMTPSRTPYGYAVNNPIVMIDQEGQKEKPFEAGKSKPITKVPGTETPISYIYNSRGEPISYSPKSSQAYNCHSYAWHKSQGDPADPENAGLVQGGVTKWDQSPADDIKSSKAKQLGRDDPNKTGDIVVYFLDNNSNGKYDEGEFIEHSAVVKEIDKEGNTTVVKAKMGQDAIAENHPGAPGYYDKDGNTKVSRAYFRLPEDIKKEAKSDAKPAAKAELKLDLRVKPAVANKTYVAPSPALRKAQNH